MTSIQSPSLDIHLDATELAAALRVEARRGLTATPKVLPLKWFYDERGSELFEAITALPEYYPARREREILRVRADDIVALSRPETLVELGSGSATKTRILLHALTGVGAVSHYVAFDICEQAVRDAGAAIVRGYPGRWATSGATCPASPATAANWSPSSGGRSATWSRRSGARSSPGCARR